MTRRRSTRSRSLLSAVGIGPILAAVWLVSLGSVRAQDTLPEFNLFGELGQEAESGEPVKIEASFEVAEGTREGRLHVKATIDPGWHAYSVTQPPGGPTATVIKLGDTSQATLAGAFEPDSPPTRRMDEVYPGVPIEEHEKQVVWTAPLRFAEGVDPAQAVLPVAVDGLVCKDSCRPFGAQVEAKFTGTYQADTSVREYRPEDGHVAFSASIQPEAARPGETLQVKITAVPDPAWHIYAWEPVDPDLISKPALIVIQAPEGWTVGQPQVSQQPEPHETGLEEQPIVNYHKDPVTWTVPIQVPANAQRGTVKLTGSMGYQLCTDTNCDLPLGWTFEVSLPVAEDQALAGTRDITGKLMPADYADVAKLAAERAAASPAAARGGAAEAGGVDLDNLQLASDEEETSLAAAIGLAILGGFILNFMPCVLPVIGLKVLAFVEQAGAHRSRIFVLNLWYSLGLMSVFMALAFLLVAFNLGWGQQSQSPTFTIILTSVVFAMGLSFLGVWEIPIPGFVGSSDVAKYSERQEGLTAAYLKGVIATLVAVPCSGPALATALAWCTGKPSYLVYLIFFCMGVGMAAPYLIIGLNPKLVSFLPKPGAWMETFKEFLGFCLLGAVVFFMSYLPWGYVLPTITFLFGLWMACWLIGKIRFTAPTSRKMLQRGAAVAIAAGVGYIAFSLLIPVMESRFVRDVDKEISLAMASAGESSDTLVSTRPVERERPEHELPWEAFTPERLMQEISAGNTVMVDFTADWCATCKTLEKTVLNTQRIKSKVEEHGVVTLVADWTRRDDDITKMLERLGSKQVPVLAIFPAGNPQQPIVKRGGYTTSSLLEALEEAGPSKNVARVSGEPQVTRTSLQ